MKKLGLLLIVVLLAVSMAGCATSKMQKTVLHLDGTKDIYSVNVTTFGQDFSGSNLEAQLDPDGQTTFSAGMMDNTASPVTGETMAATIELVRLIWEIKTATPPPTP